MPTIGPTRQRQDVGEPGDAGQQHPAWPAQAEEGNYFLIPKNPRFLKNISG